jgi:dTDP-4-amino-4,6-dideoxygalactose transaminase
MEPTDEHGAILNGEILALDLRAQHEPLRGALEAAFRRVLDSGAFILGPEVAAFEREAAAALGAAHAVGVSSGTDALLAMLIAAGVGPGDEVVTTPLSFFATAEAIARVGARPVFADVDEATFNLDDGAACARLGPRTRAALVVHLFGRPARVPRLEAACAAGGIALLEDAAQAAGAWGAASDGGGAGGRAARRPVGTWGRAGALSFFPSKNLGALGDAGLVTTGDAALAERVRRLRAHGASERHRHLEIGGNFRLDELQAALLRVKLPHLPAWNERRRAIAGRYRAALAGLPCLPPPDDPGCVWNQLVVRVPERRDELAAHLRARGIATAIYYPVPLHLQPAFAHLGHRPGDLPRAERAAREALALPLHPELSDAAVDRVAAAVRSFYR